MVYVFIAVPGSGATSISIPDGYPDALKLLAVKSIVVDFSGSTVSESDATASLSDARTIALESAAGANEIYVVVYRAKHEVAEYEQTPPSPHSS